MTLKPAFLGSVLSVWIGIAAADGFTPPPTKEGLWETHSTQIQQGKTVSDTSVKMCQSKGAHEVDAVDRRGVEEEE